MISMANGRKGDHPITDIVHWKIPVFSPTADALIAEIIRLGGQKELEGAFNLFQPPALAQFEPGLQQLRDRLLADAKDRGWEV
jgi:hypothetical protein